MDIIWDEKKNHKLRTERGISFDEVAALIVAKKYVRIVTHPKRPHQRIFLVPIKGYVHAVPFVIDAESNIVLKTVFPSREFNELYGGSNESKA